MTLIVFLNTKKVSYLHFTFLPGFNLMTKYYENKSICELYLFLYKFGVYYCHVCLCTMCMPCACGDWKKCQIPWNWNYLLLLAIMRELGPESESSEWISGNLDWWAIFLPMSHLSNNNFSVLWHKACNKNRILCNILFCLFCADKTSFKT